MRAPPSSSSSASSPMAIFTSGGPTEKDPGPSLDHDRVVAHAREVGAAGGRGAEHDADGRDALGRELGQAAELLPPGHEDVGLAGQVGSPRLDQEDEREAVGLGHVHGAEQLLDRRGAGRSSPHRRVVGDEQALGVGDLAQRHGHPAPEGVVGLQAGERAQLENGSAGIDQSLDALAHHQLAARPVPFDIARAPAGQHLVVQRADVRDQEAHGLGVGAELVAGDGQVGGQGRAHGGVASQDGVRLWRKASMPSAASAPANSSAERVRAPPRALPTTAPRRARPEGTWWRPPRRARLFRTEATPRRPRRRARARRRPHRSAARPRPPRRRRRARR